MTTVYASTSCIRTACVDTAIQRLLNLGFNNIELSGGLHTVPDLLRKLKSYQAQGCSFLCHNYFPPPHEDFVLNLASLDDVTHSRSIALVKEAIGYSRELKVDAYGVHAGFLLDLHTTELGKVVAMRAITDRELAYDRFVATVADLFVFAHNNGVRLYVENNVYSAANFNRYGADIPFLACTSKSYYELKHAIEALMKGNVLDKASSSLQCPLLLDLAHLKVSCGTLGLDLEKEFNELATYSDYWHISENDGLCDSNKPISQDSMLLKMIQKTNFIPRLITLEIYDEWNLVDSYKRLLDIIL